MLTHSEILIRLLVAAVLGGLIGLERERSHKVAGLRTHLLVALGSALIALISVYMYEQWPSVNGVNGFDYHLIANIIVGIGFIGGGAIMRHGSRVIGTTTAATLWAVAALGIACGVGFYYGAVVTALIVYFVLTVLWRVEQKLMAKGGHEAEFFIDEREGVKHNDG